MKKKIALLLIFSLIFCFVLCSCGDEEPADPSDDNSQTGDCEGNHYDKNGDLYCDFCGDPIDTDGDGNSDNLEDDTPIIPVT